MLNGISRVVQSRLLSLSSIDGFDRAWTTLLDTIKECAHSNSAEVFMFAASTGENYQSLTTKFNSKTIFYYIF